MIVYGFAHSKNDSYGTPKTYTDARKHFSGKYDNQYSIAEYIRNLLMYVPRLHAEGYVATAASKIFSWKNILNGAGIIKEHNCKIGTGQTQFYFRDPGNTVFHVSEYANGEHGCSVFFAPFVKPSGTNGDKNAEGTILAIGKHHNAQDVSNEYNLTWKNPRWRINDVLPPDRITLPGSAKKTNFA